jgi:MFS family permease
MLIDAPEAAPLTVGLAGAFIGMGLGSAYGGGLFGPPGPVDGEGFRRGGVVGGVAGFVGGYAGAVLAPLFGAGVVGGATTGIGAGLLSDFAGQTTAVSFGWQGTYNLEQFALAGATGGLLGGTMGYLTREPPIAPRIHPPSELQCLAQSEYERLIASGMSNREIGPALSVAQDLRTGRVSAIYRNDPLGRMPAQLDSTIAQRLPTAPEYIRTRGIGSHAEVYAVNDLLAARPGAMLNEIQVFTMEVASAARRGQYKPPCPQCAHLLDGVTWAR